GCSSALRYPNGFQYAPYKPYDFNQQTALQEVLWDELEKWQGVPYKWGGNSKRGVDCSGLAVIVYKKLFGISLPRSTKEQVRTGTNVSKKRIKPRDLIFFLSPKKDRHVGIYLGNRKFTHASGSKKMVVISNIDHSYWRRAYWTSRRVLAENYAQTGMVKIN
ncbi:NlpC/P60 family protein, partial [Desulfobacterales bacterium HSG17]|nr:NlpC/P60 family protein [Desulfobacterales bacterium HSG17]